MGSLKFSKFDFQNNKIQSQLRTTCFYKKKIVRSSRLEVLCKKDVLRNFTKFTEKYLCQNLFFDKVAGL